MATASRDSPTNDNWAYYEHLFDATTDGYISFVEINNKSGEKFVRSYSTNIKSLRSIATATEGREDTYVSPNTYFMPRRSVSNIRQYRCLFIDLDIEKYGKHSKEETFKEILELVTSGRIPMPSMMTDSGRGFHLYFRVKNAPRQALQTFQELEDYLYYQLKDLGADLSATDSARVLRIPGTINSRNGEVCSIIYRNNDIEYTMYDLREHYLNYEENKRNRAKKKEFKPKKVCIVRNLFNSYSLHMGRVDDIQTICKLRNYDVEGYRNFVLHCFSYWKGIYVRDTEQLLRETMEFNGKFKKPLSDSEVRTICKSVKKAIEKFIDYEQGIRSGLVKRVTKGMRDKPGYWYTNAYLLKRLEITDAEQEKLKTIIGLPEKYRRRNVKRLASRKNDNGLTMKQQAKQDNIERIIELRKENPGMSSLELSKILKVTKRYVNQLLGGN